MGTFMVIILISVAVIGVAAYFGQQRANRLVSEGKAIKRNADFYKSAEIFTVSGVDYDSLKSEVNKTDFSELKTDIYSGNDGKKEILFKSKYEWNAQISYLGEENGQYKYQFCFTAWNAYHGTPPRLDTMNMMETKVEKMFLRLDAQAKVVTEEMKLTTKSRRF